jgi:hypothetical protein
MTPPRANSVLLLCLACVLLAGCPGKKPVAVAPPPAPAPVASPEPTPQAPGTQAQNQESQPATQGTPPPDVSQEQPAEKADKAKPKNGKARPAAKKPAPAQNTAKTTETARNNPPRIIVKPDGTEAAPASGTISPGPAQADSTRNQATTEQLLQGAETTLNNLKRQLSKDEEAIAAQIRSFADQSRQATKENDSARAHNLALKAYLLSDDLAKRR